MLIPPSEVQETRSLKLTKAQLRRTQPDRNEGLLKAPQG
jgi:hypothetical protein